MLQRALTGLGEAVWGGGRAVKRRSSYGWEGKGREGRGDGARRGQLEGIGRDIHREMGWCSVKEGNAISIFPVSILSRQTFNFLRTSTLYLNLFSFCVRLDSSARRLINTHKHTQTRTHK